MNKGAKIVSSQVDRAYGPQNFKGSGGPIGDSILNLCQAFQERVEMESQQSGQVNEHGLLIAETPANRAEWLEARRRGLGGSDAAAAVGLSRWKTPLQLYLDKRGEADDAEENDAMRWGNMLEPVVRQEYANKTGHTVIRVPGIVRHPVLSFALANVDGLIPVDAKILECKTSQNRDEWGEAGTDQIPQEYALQTQHYLGVTGYQVCDIAVLFGVRDFRIYTVEADSELQEMLFAQEAAFWQRVQDGNPPDPVDLADVKRRWPISKAAQVTASGDDVLSWAKLQEVRREIAALEAAEEQLKASLQRSMADAAELLDSDGTMLATWKTTKPGRRFDMDAFKESHPDIWAQFMVDSRPQRRFLPKFPNAKETSA